MDREVLRMKGDSMKKVIIVITVAVLFLTTFLACASGSRSARKSHSRIGSPREFSEVLEFDVNTDFSNLTLKLDLRVDTGTVRWTVLDPEGDEKWTGQLDAGEKLKQSRSFELMEGKWKVTMSGENLSGEVLMEWTGTK
ncbi:MAG TPA: hypothetical protein DCE14_04675 [Kosmotogaceae bacterium]|nr:hypothetical protein [Kosmotogaceae bacterium]